MAASVGKAAYGSLLVWYNKPVAELTNMTGPSSDGDEIDITNHDSPNSCKEFALGLLNTGAFGIEGNLVPSDTIGQIQLITDHAARTPRAMFVHFTPDTTSFSATAYFEDFKTGAPVGDKISFRGTLKITGKPTLLTTASTGLTTPYFALRDNGANAVTPTPAAAGDVYLYNATLDAADTHVAIQPTATAGTIYVNGTTVATGAWSSDIAVSAGGSKLLVVEVREANKASKVYRIWVTRPA